MAETHKAGIWVVVLAALASGAWGQQVMETARAIPVAYDVDVVVVGGASGGVAAAVAAAQQGAKVFLASSRPYLGEDLCATWRLWPEPGDEAREGIAETLFGDDAVPPTPMHVKRTLDEALIRAKVAFLYGCYATEVLRDADGNIAGIVMANRSGRQAVRAKVIIDATPRATVARLAGTAFEPYPAAPQAFTRVVVGGPVRPGAPSRILPTPLHTETPAKNYPADFSSAEYTLTLAMRDGSFASLAEAEQQARDVTWTPEQVGASESLFQVPPDPMHGKKHLEGVWPGSQQVDLDAFRPASSPGVFVLGGCADVSREAAGALLRPTAFLALGTRIGQAAAQEAAALPLPKKAHVPAAKGKKTAPGDVHEVLTGIRTFDTGSDRIQCGAHPLPVLGSYDVVVVGGGTGGAPAGIAAARQGAKTLVIEYLNGLGGVSTLGLIGTYYHGYRGGFTAEIDKGVAGMDGREHEVSASWNVEWKMEWYRSELRKAGAAIWFGSLCCGVLREGNRITGVVVATPEGRGVVLAKAVIDATGNADVAAAAGAPCVSIDAEDIAVQGSGMPPREPGAHYTNTDYTMTDDSDVVDTWRTLAGGRRKYAKAFDLAQIVDSRERRRVVGDFTISPLDIWNERTFPDTVVVSESDFDTHGYTVHPFFAIQAPHKKRVSAYTPYRSLLPKGLDGLIVIGLGISAHRDAMPILRMQPDIQNQGYAMGVAAAMAAKTGTGTRGIDLKALQAHLVEKGNLPRNVLSDKDSYPFSHEQIAGAVARMRNDYDGLSVALAFPSESMPLLRDAFKQAATDTERLIYAHVLGMLGDATGSACLAQAVEAAAWDKGWAFTSMGQFGGSMSPVDSLILALGRTRAPEAFQPIAGKAAALDTSSEFSHFRTIALALEALRDAKAVPVLARLLAMPGMTGHACGDIESAGQRAELNDPNADRDHSLRELMLARALYRCGDADGAGKRILEQYAQDLRGHFARHANAVLNTK